VAAPLPININRIKAQKLNQQQTMIFLWRFPSGRAVRCIFFGRMFMGKRSPARPAKGCRFHH